MASSRSESNLMQVIFCFVKIFSLQIRKKPLYNNPVKAFMNSICVDKGFNIISR